NNIILYHIHDAPPKPTLFPYTTLFRSRLRRGLHNNTVLIGEIITSSSRRIKMTIKYRTDKGSKNRNSRLILKCPSKKSVIPWGKDRKSTRLNSSHVKISYAVFCLKKKK